MATAKRRPAFGPASALATRRSTPPVAPCLPLRGLAAPHALGAQRLRVPAAATRSGGEAPLGGRDHPGGAHAAVAVRQPAPPAGLTASPALPPQLLALLVLLRERAAAITQHLTAAVASAAAPAPSLAPAGATAGAARAYYSSPHHAAAASSSASSAAAAAAAAHQEDDGHWWGDGLAYDTHVPWSHGPHAFDAAPSGSAHTHAHADASSASSSSSSAAAAAAAAPSPLLLLPPLELAHLHTAAAARLVAVQVAWHAVLSLHQRAWGAAANSLGRAAAAAERARRGLPPPHHLPHVARWSAASLAVHVEEGVAMALARAASAASAAAAGAPAATALAVTGSAATAAAAAVAAAPHLPLLVAARRRLLAAARSALDELHGLQRGCTTHVLLRFLLFSPLSPGLRRRLVVRLEALARRAETLALLEGQHAAWLQHQPPPLGSPAAHAAAAAASAASSARRSGSGAAAAPSSPSASPSSLPGAAAAAIQSAPLAARWYGRVFAAEMRACERQLGCEGEGAVGGGAAPSGDAATGDPPGRFDLRDLYRLVRVLEVAVEDLGRYDGSTDGAAAAMIRAYGSSGSSSNGGGSSAA